MQGAQDPISGDIGRTEEAGLKGRENKTARRGRAERMNKQDWLAEYKFEQEGQKTRKCQTKLKGKA
jgi:hypothetical protein